MSGRIVIWTTASGLRRGSLVEACERPFNMGAGLASDFPNLRSRLPFDRRSPQRSRRLDQAGDLVDQRNSLSDLESALGRHEMQPRDVASDDAQRDSLEYGLDICVHGFAVSRTQQSLKILSANQGVAALPEISDDLVGEQETFGAITRLVATPRQGTERERDHDRCPSTQCGDSRPIHSAKYREEELHA